MTFSYSITQPQSTKDLVRLLVSDTDSSDALLQDEEITAFITLEGGTAANAYRVAGMVAQQIAGQMGRQGLQSDGQVAQHGELRAADYRQLAQRFFARADLGAVPVAGGISISDKETNQENTDLVQPAFSRDMLTPPGPSTATPPTTTLADLLVPGFP